MNIETEYKYVIKKPDFDFLRGMAGYTESAITQIYLKNEVATHRVRRREYSSGKVVYTENKKVRLSKMSSTEYEREISEEEYLSLKENIEDGAAPLYKIRRTFEYMGKIFEIDCYDAWKNTCIMEIELENEEEKVEYPPFIEIIADVTGNKLYSNHSMAHSFPTELAI